MQILINLLLFIHYYCYINMGCLQSQIIIHPDKSQRQILMEPNSQNHLGEIKQSNSKIHLIGDISYDNSKDYGVRKFELFLLKKMELIQKDLFAPNIYLWIDQDIHNQQNTKTLSLLKQQGFDPKLYKSLEEAKDILKNYQNSSRFRIITSAKMGEAVCKQFKSNEKIIHIYIFCGYKPAGQQLQKKWRKIKFCAVDVKQFIENIKTQSRYDNKFTDLPNFLKITNKDNTHDNTLINNSRYNLHGLFLFKNRIQAKDDFVKLAKYFFPVESEPFKSDIAQFQKDYPIQYNHILALTWYTKQTFFYGFLNNMIRSTINPLETVYLRHPFESIFKAIKNLYDKKNYKRSLKVYRGGFINNEQLDYMEKNVGEFIEMYGFMSTSEDYGVADGFRQQYNGNSLITVLIQDQDRQSTIDYGYVSLVDYSAFPSQKQVLFNSLNVFKIISYVKQNEINKITLKYGQLARIVKLGEEKVSQKQRNIIYNYKHQQEIISRQIKNQGDIFKYVQMYDTEVQYRQKYIIQNQGQQNLELANQLNNMGLVYYNKADYNKALQYYQRAFNIIGEDHNQTAITLNYIGIVYKSKAEYDRALEYYQRALKINLNKLGENDNITADILSNIGNVYKSKAKYKKALQYYQRAFNISMNILGENHNNTALKLQNIGNVYKSSAEYNKALQYFQKALKIKMNILGENHSDTANTLNNMGIINKSKADYTKALEYYSKSLNIKMNILGENHCSTADTLQNIGIVYYSKAEYNKALQYYQRVLKTNMNILGENHNSTANTLQNMGNVYKSKAEYNKALQYCQRSLKINRNIFGENHNSTANTLNHIGSIYADKAEYSKALQYYQSSLKIKMNILGEDHTNTAITLLNIGSLYYKQKNYRMAQWYFKRCYQIRVKIFGGDHEFTIEAMNKMKNCNQKQFNVE